MKLTIQTPAVLPDERRGPPTERLPPGSVLEPTAPSWLFSWSTHQAPSSWAIPLARAIVRRIRSSVIRSRSLGSSTTSAPRARMWSRFSLLGFAASPIAGAWASPVPAE
jgi:hypothetical protein